MKTRCRTITLGAVVLSLLLAPRLSWSGQLDLGAKGMFGFAGEAEFEQGQWSGNDDMEATAGFGLFIEYSLHRYFDLGFQPQFLWWNTDGNSDANIDRNTLIDFNILAKGKYPFFRKRMELYIAMPLGLAVSVPSGDLDGIDTGVGFNMSIVAGYSFAIFRSFGVFLEMGWTWHMFSNEPEGGGDSLEASFHQMAFNFGSFYRF